ncbi:hypothetical protein SBP28_000195 [Candidozyma auris]|nr:hypothetical protein CJJ09_000220 [[Candida] auris]
MTSSALTVQSLAESICDDMMTNIIRQVTLNTVSRYRTLQQCVEGDYLDAISPTRSTGNRDIFGNDKTKLKNSETSRYFECGKCGRQIAGGRFAQHINKCLERGRR